MVLVSMNKVKINTCNKRYIMMDGPVLQTFKVHSPDFTTRAIKTDRYIGLLSLLPQV